MHRPTVSVIVPVYNGERFVGAALDSIRRQTVPAGEVIIVDDGSTDGTAALLRRMAGVRFLQQANQGAPVARNRGIAAASGDTIALLDADDLWPADHLSRLLSRFAESPRLDVVFGRTQAFAGDGPMDELLGGPATALLFGSALFRRAAFDEVGLLDASMPLGDDTDWFLRAMEQGLAIEAIDAVTLLYRVHAASLSADQAALRRSFAVALKRSLDRRRARSGGTASDLPAIPGCGAIDAALRRTIDLRRRQLIARAAGEKAAAPRTRE